MYYRNAQAVIVGFDVTERYTFEGCDRWIQEVRANNRDCVVAAVGNKIDLVDKRRVSTEEARKFFERMDPPIPYFETSAKTGEGVNELFESVARMVMCHMNENVEKEEDDKPKFTVTFEEEEKGESRCVIC